MIALYSKKSMVGGSREIVWAKLSDCNGNSLRDMDVSLAIIPHGQHPTDADFKTPDQVTHVGRMIRAGLVFDAPIPASGQKRVFDVFARGTESPEDIWVHCGQFTVI